MRAGVDGEIRIDSRIDPKGFNEGMKKLGGSMSGVMKVLVTGLKVVAIAVAIVVAAVVLVGVALIALTSVMLRWGEKMVDTLLKSQSVTGDFRNRVLQLKGAFDTLKGTMMALGATLLNALAPIIMRIIAWLIKAINFISMFIASLTGQATVMQYVAGATESAATGAGDLADNTDKAKKAAKGALAAFDELNVLQQQTATTAGAGVPVGGPMMVEVPVEKPAWMIKLGEWWDWLKEKIGGVWNWIWTNVLGPFWIWLSTEIAPRLLTIVIEAFGLLWDILVEVGKLVWDVAGPALIWLWENALKPLAEWTGGAIITILDWIIGLLQTVRKGLAEGGLLGALEALGGYLFDTFKTIVAFLIEEWNKFDIWFRKITEPWAEWIRITVTEPIANWFKTAGENIKFQFLLAKTYITTVWAGVYMWFKTVVIDPIVNWFKTALESIKFQFLIAKTNIQTIWASVYMWFKTTVIDPIKNGFIIALGAIKTVWENTFTGIKNFVRNTINSIIDFINGMIRAVISGINAVIRALNSIKINIPSILGTPGYSVGLNIPTVSAPQIPRLAKGAVIPPNAAFAAILGEQRSGKNIEAPEGLIRQIIQEEIGNIKADIEISFGGSLGQLVRELKPFIDKENVRIGDSLVKRTA